MAPLAPDRREIEIKLPLPDAAAGERILLQAGFRVTRPRTFEDNTLFDTPDGRLRDASTVLRVRQAGRRATLTYKGPPTPGRYKDREELETTLGDPAAFTAILHRLGYVAAFRYQKYRTEFTDGQGAATLDETPVGCYLELEGAPEWIDAAAGRLGFTQRDYITASYLRLYREYCAARGLTPSHMLFREPAAPGSV
jgi:adenylate cyclase class 2